MNIYLYMEENDYLRKKKGQRYNQKRPTGVDGALLFQFYKEGRLYTWWVAILLG